MDQEVEHHFVAFVQKGNKVYDLDGRKSGPVVVGEVKESFLKVSNIPLLESACRISKRQPPCRWSGFSPLFPSLPRVLREFPRLVSPYMQATIGAGAFVIYSHGV